MFYRSDLALFPRCFLVIETELLCPKPYLTGSFTVILSVSLRPQVLVIPSVKVVSDTFSELFRGRLTHLGCLQVP